MPPACQRMRARTRCTLIYAYDSQSRLYILTMLSTEMLTTRVVVSGPAEREQTVSMRCSGEQPQRQQQGSVPQML
jgi:predicted transposase YdaD